jgi:hypothetical protein
MISFRNKIIIALLSVLFLSVVFTSSQIQGQTYEYLSTLIPGATYEWQVTTLSTTGSVGTSFLIYGNESLEQGDLFSVKIIDDVNNITGGDPLELLNPVNVWAEFYLNGNFKTNDTSEIGILDLGWTMFAFIDFLQPVIYTNSTGNYSYIEVLHENFANVKYEERTDVKYHGYYESIYLRYKQSSSLSSKTWTIKMQMHEDYQEDDFIDPENWQKEQTTTDRTIEIRFNVETGLVVYLYYDYLWHNIRQVEGSTDDDTNAITLQIESTQLPTVAPFSYGYALIGVLTICLVFYMRRRRK